MKIVISSGHGKHIRGASGSPVPPQMDEVDEVRLIVDKIAAIMRGMVAEDGMGVEVITFHDNTSTSQSANLDAIVSFHNKQGPHDLDVSVHMNAFDGKANGCEVLYVSNAGLEYAEVICNEICKAGGFTNRGAKKRTDLKFLNSTNEVSVLLEVAFCDNTSDCEKLRKNYEAVCSAIAGAIVGEEVPQPEPVPPEPDLPTEPKPPWEPQPDTERMTIAKGDKGPDVAELQKALGVLVADGDFGAITDTWVKAFQGASGLTADGVVGPKTWAEVDDLTERVNSGEPPLPKALADQVYTMAQTSEVADYSWPDRGVPPPGYIAGMALSFAYAMRLSSDQVLLMSRALGNPDLDALAWYSQQFAALGMSNNTPIDRLRHLFVLMIGLGPRESSGRYFEGRDMSASNVQSDTCEAGLFQTSWNIRNGSPVIAPLLPEFWDNPNGFLPQFKENLSPSANNLNSYGSGDGLKYQFLSRFCPLFHIMVTGCGLRVLRKHWGPINERKAQLKKEADDLLKEVQALVESVA